MQSNATKGVVGKLSSRAKGPFVITKDLSYNIFKVQQYNEPSSTKQKYKTVNCMYCHLRYFPSDPLDTIAQRYLNKKYTTIVNPLMATESRTL